MHLRRSIPVAQQPDLILIMCTLLMCRVAACRAYGYRFDHRSLVMSQRKQVSRIFLENFRHSQMYEVLPCSRPGLCST